jgi:hypothetical protein
VYTPLFLYIYVNRQTLPPWICKLLLVLGIAAIAYFSHKLYKGTKAKWVALLHIFIVAPLLISIGYKCESTERQFFEVLLLLTFALFGYHLYNFIVYYEQ